MKKSLLKLTIWLIVAIGLASASTVSAATYTVNSTDDDLDGACDHPYVDAATDCTFREALQVANADSAADIITFNINVANFADDGDGQFIITPLSEYSTISNPVTITGTAMWDNSGTISNRPGIAFDGTSVNARAFIVTAPAVKIQGIKIENFGGIGIRLASSGNTIGSDCDGSTDAKERNDIINNTGSGIFIGSGSDSNIIKGNYIGIDEDGDTAAGNGGRGIYLVDADSNIIGVSSTNCAVGLQRNTIGANTNSGIELDASSSNVIAGNYIGVDTTGSVDRGNGGSGVYLVDNSTSNYIGTNGNGVNDANEANVIAGNTRYGVYLSATAAEDAGGTGPNNNRISGNIIGMSANESALLNNNESSIVIQSDDNIIGWCDTSVNAAICSNDGTVDNQGNLIMAAEYKDGIRLGVYSEDARVYGNNIGITSNGGNLNNPGQNGIGINKDSTGHIIGGSTGDESNSISYFTNGIRIFHDSSVSTEPAENITIENNDITNHSGNGVQCVETLEYASGSFTYEVTLKDNTIDNNGGDGIELNGCSWDIDGNDIRDNSAWGIQTIGMERPDDPHADAVSDPDDAATNYDNPYDAPSPNNFGNDLVSRPRIQNNTFRDNASGGMYFLDTAATNSETIYADNTFSDTQALTRVAQYWYGAIELLDTSNTPITSGSYTVTATGANSGGCSNCTGSASAINSANASQALWGPTGLNVDNASTWMLIPEYIIDSTGTTTDYNPYTITVTGDREQQVGVTYDFNGINDAEEISVGGMSSGLTTNDMYRYQIAEVQVSTTPATPNNSSPTDGATKQALTPTLQGSAFSDTAETHSLTTWNIYSTSDLCDAGAGGNIHSKESSSSLTSYAVPSSTLSTSTKYYWNIQYTNSFGNISSASTCTSFTTLSTAPTFAGSIPDQSWAEDADTGATFDLDNYFSDDEGEDLTYTFTTSEENITISINESTAVVKSATDWNGNAEVSFNACDTDSECASSNTFTVSVSAVNDAPSTPTGLSPSDGDTTSSRKPTLSWSASTDVDHTSEELFYQVRLSTDKSPESDPDVRLTSSTGSTSVKPSSNLNDETTYYYVVRAVDGDNENSEWSDVQNFTVNSSLDPDIALTKEIALVSSSSITMRWLNTAVAILYALPIPLPANAIELTSSIVSTLQIILHSLLWLALLGVGISLIALLALGRSVADIHHLLISSPARIFARIHQIESQVVRQVSYHRFRQRLLALRSILTIAILSFASMLVVNATQTPLIQSGVQAIVQAITTEPGQQLEVTVLYENSGDGDATGTTFTDQIPDDVNYVTGSLILNSTTEDSVTVSDSTISFSPGTITDSGDSSNSKGTIRYRLLLDNPYPSTSLSLAAASLTANEFSTEQSNTLSLSVSIATVRGTVTSSSGAALSGVTVEVYEGSTLLTQTTTDSDGDYQIIGLGDGDYTVTVIAPSGYVTPAISALAVNAGESYTADFSLIPSSGAGDDSEDSTETGGGTDESTEEVTEEMDNGDEEDSEESDSESSETELDVPEGLEDDFVDIEIPSEEEQERIDELTEQLQVTIDEAVDADGLIWLDSSGSVFESVVDDLQDILFNEPKEIIIGGQAEPFSKITISICYELATTDADAEGQWVMVIPEELLVPGENVLFATSEKDGVVSAPVEVARVVVDEDSVISRTALIGYISLLFAVLILNTLLYIVYRNRMRRRHNRDSNPWWKIISVLSVLASIGAFLANYGGGWQKVYDMTATGRHPQEAIVLDEINSTDLPAGITAEFVDAQTIQFSGAAPADTDLAITLCDNQPFRQVTSNLSGAWETTVPVESLPKASFTVSAQAIVDEVFGSPHRLVDLTIDKRSSEVYSYILLALAYVFAILSTLVLWMYVKKQLAQLSNAKKMMNLHNKKLLLISILTACVLLAAGCIATEEQVDTVIEGADEQNAEFVEEYAGGAPEEIIEIRYQETITLYGPSDEYFTPYDDEGNPSNYELAYYIAQNLNVEYEKVAYVQLNSGSKGLESILQAMDETAPGVADTLRDFEEYHQVTNLDSEYWTEQLSALSTSEDKANFVIETLSEQYRELGFSDDVSELAPYQKTAVAAVAEISGISEEDLAVIYEGKGYLEGVIEVLPDDWQYKEAILKIL